MDIILQINDLAEKHNLIRTITNFSFKDKCNLYSRVLEDIYNCYEYDKLKLSNIDSISYVLYCGINKNTINKNICFINHNILELNDKCNQINNVNINIVKSNENTTKVVHLLLNTKNFFRRYAQKKHYKQRNSFTLIKKNYEDKCVFKHENTYYSKTITQEKHVVKTVTVIKCYIHKERVEFIGRIMLPNSITLIFKNRSRVILYNTNKITIIFVKNISLHDAVDQMYNILSNIYTSYDMIIPNDYPEVSVYFDFMYVTMSDIHIIPPNKFNLRFISNNKIMIHKITNISNLVEIINYIGYLEKTHWPETFKLLNSIKNPFTADKQIILTIINKLWEIR